MTQTSLMHPASRADSGSLLVVDVWTWPLVASPDGLAVLAALLDPAERARADRFFSGEDCDAFIVGRGQMRRLLAERAKVLPQELVFTYGEAGKPALASGPYFNLTHSGGRAALAICQDAPVGIDIERPRLVEPRLARRFFSASENEALDLLPREGWLEGFFRIWTRKEAILKALGCGLGRDTRTFSVSVEPVGPVVVTGIEPTPEMDSIWSLLPFTPADGFFGAIAVQANGRSVELRLHDEPQP